MSFTPSLNVSASKDVKIYPLKVQEWFVHVDGKWDTEEAHYYKLRILAIDEPKSSKNEQFLDV